MASSGSFDRGCPTTPLFANNWVIPPQPDPFTPPHPRSPVPEIFLTRKRKNVSPRYTAPTKFQRIEESPNSKKPERFQSVLDRPFVHWKELDSVLATLFPEWTHYQRARIIHHLIHFLELKIGLNESIPEGLLSPSPVVDNAWRAIILETQLYQKVLKQIQDFHGKPRKMVHYSIFQQQTDTENKLRRTQSLFQVYFLETMPLSIADEQQPTPLARHLRQSSFDSSSQPSVYTLPSQRHLRQSSFDSSSQPSVYTLPSQLRQPFLRNQNNDDDDSVTSASTLYGLGLVDETQGMF
jgi:hypothetical protein